MISWLQTNFLQVQKWSKKGCCGKGPCGFLYLKTSVTLFWPVKTMFEPILCLSLVFRCWHDITMAIISLLCLFNHNLLTITYGIALFYLYSPMSQNHKIASKGLYNVYMWHLLSSTPSIRIWKISHKNPVTVDKSIPGIQYVANPKLLVSEDMCDCTTDVK